MTTEPLTIQVSPGLAKVYREAEPEERRKLELIAEMGLQSALQDTRTLQEVMRDIGRKARERGLTEEVLTEILKEGPKLTKLPDWCNIYEGMTDEEIDEIEPAIFRTD